MAMNVDAMKARAMSLGFKKATAGLSPSEEQELSELNRKIALAQVAG
jgi:hypothetical protein